MTTKNRVIPWAEREEVEWLRYTVQPPSGLLCGEYFHASRYFGATPWSRGHCGGLTVVRGDSGAILYAEFSETTMEGYYNRYFDHADKRRSDYCVWQASWPRQAKAGVVLADGMLHVEKQILARQSLGGEFDLLTGASNSMRGLLPLVKEMEERMERGSEARYYGISENFGYGITGWLQVVVERGKIIFCRYDEVFADHASDIWYPALKKYYRQSKYCSVCFEEPLAPGLPARPAYAGFCALMDMLNEQVVKTQNLLHIDALPFTDGVDYGPLWDRHSEEERPLAGFEEGKTRLRYPVWNNYLTLAKRLEAEIRSEKESRR